MKHLAVITTSFPDLTPGSEAAGSFVADFAEVLSHYVKVSVIAPSLKERKEALSADLVIYRFPVPRLPLSLLSPWNPRHWSWIIGTLLSGQKAVNNVAQDVKIDHILALWIVPSGFWARSAGKSYGIPYSVWALGSDIWSLAKMPVVRDVIRTVLRDCLVPFADGYLLQQDVAKLAGRSCEFLPSARRLSINRKKTLAAEPPYGMAYLGRWHPNKGTDLLLDALGLLVDEDWKKIRELRICGGGPLEEKVRESCASLIKAGRPVTLGGYLGKKEATDLLLWADYLLIPSRIESIPVVFSDAMQAECPVIATPVGDLPRLLDAWRVGVLAEGANACAFAGAIHSALHYPPLHYAQELQKAARDFDLEMAARKFLEKTGIKAS